MRNIKKATVIFFILTLLLALLPTNATAISTRNIIDLAASSMPASATGTNWRYANNIYYITGNGVIVTGSASTSNKRIIVEKSCTITIDGVNISTTAGSLITLNPGTDVKLKITESKNYLTSSHNTGAGIETTGATLTIEGIGELNVTGGTKGAGIGGAGGANGASIGDSGYSGAACGTVIIKSGIVKAKGSNGAGIGGGAGGNGYRGANRDSDWWPGGGNDGGPGGNGGSGGGNGTIKIIGGTITATSTNGAGIGGGRGGNGGKGGNGEDTLVFNAGHGGSGGIGGNGGGGTTIQIDGGTVTAKSTNSADIGNGNGGNGGDGGNGGKCSSFGSNGKRGWGGRGGNGGGSIFSFFKRVSPIYLEINGGKLIANGANWYALCGGVGGAGGVTGSGKGDGGSDGPGTSGDTLYLTINAKNYDWKYKYWGATSLLERSGSYPSSSFPFSSTSTYIEITTK
ncbi:MAG: hypothetical protein FWG61_09600 [Firmicutes bacterium]|nr:hypothetical protein [Bacillota bacterium]